MPTSTNCLWFSALNCSSNAAPPSRVTNGHYILAEVTKLYEVK
jgi:hypothetical protein